MIGALPETPQLGPRHWRWLYVHVSVSTHPLGLWRLCKSNPPRILDFQTNYREDEDDDTQTPEENSIFHGECTKDGRTPYLLLHGHHLFPWPRVAELTSLDDVYWFSLFTIFFFILAFLQVLSIFRACFLCRSNVCLMKAPVPG